MKKIEWKKYLLSFVITSLIFIFVFSLVSYLNGRKITSVQKIQQGITADLIGLETQFDLLKSAPCAAIERGSLSDQVDTLGRKVSYMERVRGEDDEDVLSLKRYYTLLQVKDFLLAKEVSNQCDIDIQSVLFFYKKDCLECLKQGAILTRLKTEYPWLRIYSFDIGLESSLLSTFGALYDIDTAPTLVINEEAFSGLKNKEEVLEILPHLSYEKERREHLALALGFVEKEFNLKLGEDDLLVEEDGSFTFISENTKGKEEVLFVLFDQEEKEFVFEVGNIDEDLEGANSSEAFTG